MPFTKTVKYVEVVDVDSKKITAKPEDVEFGKVFVGNTKRLEIGTMPVHEEHGDITLLAGESHTIGVGKVNKGYSVISTALAPQTVGDVEPSDIVAGKIAWSNGVKVTGSIESHIDETINLTAGQQQVLAPGYYKNCTVVGSVLSGQTVGTAIDSDILSGKIAWVNGQMVTGTMKKNIPINVKIGAGETYTLDAAYYPGGKITSETIVESTPGTAVADDMISGKTAWVNGNKITGTIQNVVPTQHTLPVNGTYTIPRGYHTGLGSVIQNVSTLSGVNITPSTEPQRIAAAGKYMAQDITVAAVKNAVNFEVPADSYLINQPINSLISSFALPVDNWHDNTTMNVYSVELVCGSAENKLIKLSGCVVINWKSDKEEPKEIAYYDVANNKKMISIKVSLNAATMAHTFDIRVDPSLNWFNNAKTVFKVKEVFHSRNYAYSE